MKKAFLLVTILFISIISTACINNLAVQELNTKAKSYLEKGDFDSAISRLNSSIDLDSTIFETHYNLGIAYIQAEKYIEAIKTLKNAISLKPSFADTYYSLAVAQENYAKQIADGTLKKEDKNEMDSVRITENGTEKKKELTAEEKTQVVQLFEQSIKSYEAYLQKGEEINDKKEVEDKIDYLKAQIQKYSTDLPSSVD